MEGYINTDIITKKCTERAGGRAICLHPKNGYKWAVARIRPHCNSITKVDKKYGNIKMEGYTGINIIKKTDISRIFRFQNNLPSGGLPRISVPLTKLFCWYKDNL